MQSMAQSTAADTAWYRLSIENTRAQYFKSLKENAPFYTGSEEVGYGQNMMGHPFFESDSLQKGSIYYDGTLYENIPILYDLVSDEVILKDYRNNYFIRLSSVKIRYFTLLTHTFIRPEPDSNAATFQDNGFYDRIYDGKTKIFVKRRKQINYTVTSEKTIYRYDQYNLYLIKKEDAYFKVTGKKSLLSLLQDKKTEIKKYVAKAKLNFKKDMENAIRKTVIYYDEIKERRWRIFGYIYYSLDF